MNITILPQTIMYWRVQNYKIIFTTQLLNKKSAQNEENACTIRKETLTLRSKTAKERPSNQKKQLKDITFWRGG